MSRSSQRQGEPGQGDVVDLGRDVADEDLILVNAGVDRPVPPPAMEGLVIISELSGELNAFYSTQNPEVPSSDSCFIRLLPASQLI